MIFSKIRSGFAKLSFAGLTKALSSTRSFFTKRLKSLFSKKLDEETLDEIEETLYEADLGVSIVQQLMGHIETSAKRGATPEELLEGIKAELLLQMTSSQSDTSHPVSIPVLAPHIILIVGANGHGKTTTIAKLAHYYKQLGKKVVVAGADTFRAAAQEQLATWAARLEIDIIKGTYNADPAAVAFDAIQAAISRKADILLIDTAGRLENKTNLMKELEKIRRTCGKALPGAPHDTFLILDATIGQNSLEIAKSFQQATPLTGLVLTKIDGSAKGGSVIAIQKALKVPVKFLATGETIEDLTLFNPQEFVHALLFDE